MQEVEVEKVIKHLLRRISDLELENATLKAMIPDREPNKKEDSEDTDTD